MFYMFVIHPQCLTILPFFTNKKKWFSKEKKIQKKSFVFASSLSRGKFFFFFFQHTNIHKNGFLYLLYIHYTYMYEGEAMRVNSTAKSNYTD